MSKFKVGDRVRITSTRVKVEPGRQFTVKTDEGEWGGEQSWGFADSAFRFRESELEPVNVGPVRERTVKEIVPGVYERLVVSDPTDDRRVGLAFDDHSHRHYFTSRELTAAIATLTTIRDALDEVA